MSVRKCISLLIFSYIMTGCLISCSNSPVDEGISKADSISKKTYTPISGKGQEPVTLVFSYGGTTLGKGVKEIISQFMNRYPYIDIEIQVLPQSSDDRHNAYVTAMSSENDNIDVIAGDIIWTPEFATAGWITDLDGRISGDHRGEFLESTIESCSLSDKLYAVPWFTDTGVLFYRTDIERRPPETWEELIKAAGMKRHKVKYGYVFQADQYEGLVCNALEYIWNSGGEVLKGDNAVIDSPETIGGLNTFIEIVKSGIAPPGVVTWREEDSQSAFREGNALFMRNWASAYILCNSEGSKVKGKFDIAPLPVSANSRAGRSKGGTLGGVNLMLSADSRYPDEAWKLIEYMTGYEMQVQNSIMTGYLPTRRDVYHDRTLREQNPWLPEMLEMIETSRFRPMFPFYPSMSDSMQRNFHKALTGNISSVDAVKCIDKDFKDTLARFWIYDLTHFCRINK